MYTREETVRKTLQIALPLLLIISFASMGASLQVLSCKVTEAPLGEGYTDLLGVSDTSNAHAQDHTKTDYNYRVACTDKFNYTEVGNSPGKAFALFSDPSNAHVGTTESSSYEQTAYLNSKSSETYVNISYNFTGTCGEKYECMATLSDSDNAHIASCPDETGNSYALAICGRVVDNEPPTIDCDECISPQPAEVGQDVSITPEVTDDGFGVKSIEICLNRQCGEHLDCDSADCTTDFDTPENRDVYVRAVDRGGNSITERIGGLFVGKGLERPCSANEQCISGNCESGICQPQRIPPEVEFSQGGGEIDSIKMSILDTVKVNVSVFNAIPFSDTITIRFGGRATSGLVAGNVTEKSGVDCNTDNSVCNVSVPAETERQIETNIQGLSVGTGALTVNAKSLTTDLEAKDGIEINTRPRTEEGPVSAPALTIPYLAVLVLLASTYFYLALGRRS